MFGGLNRPIRPPLRTPPTIPYLRDVPGTRANTFGHVAPYAASQYRHRMMLYNQRKKEFADKSDSNMSQQLQQDEIDTKYMKHFEKCALNRNISERVDQKWKDYEASVDLRRNKLRDQIANEERAQTEEVVKAALCAHDSALDEMKTRVEVLKSRRENERLEIVKEKRLQQYSDKSEQFRIKVSHDREMEARNAQLAQMYENEIRKKSEQELDDLWHNMTLKMMEDLTEREELDESAKEKRNQNVKAVWDVQCKAAELAKEKMKQEIDERRIQLNQIKEELDRQDMLTLDEKRRERNKLYDDLHEQMKQREEFLRKERENELKCVDAYQVLQSIEIEKEKKLDEKEAMKNDWLQYFDHLNRLDEERKIEEKRIDAYLAEELKSLQLKEDELRCHFERARRNLQKVVLQERDDQIIFRRQQAKEQLENQQAERESDHLLCQQNERVREEYNRRKYFAAQQYKNDLLKQMEYKKTLKNREKEELEYQLQKSKEQDAKYESILVDVLENDINLSAVHPFRQVINREKSPCPEQHN